MGIKYKCKETKSIAVRGSVVEIVKDTIIDKGIITESYPYLFEKIEEVKAETPKVAIIKEEPVIEIAEPIKEEVIVEEPKIEEPKEEPKVIETKKHKSKK